MKYISSIPKLLHTNGSKITKIGPRFLGHLTEEGRVIGFAIERITNFRHAKPEDLALCLIHDDRVKLVDFNCASQCNDAEVLEKEFRGLEKDLSDKSGKGSSWVVGSSPE